MKQKKLRKIGSLTAKSGFKNEHDVAVKFNNWKTDKDAQKWLIIMGYLINEIKDVKAVELPNRYKSDIQVQINIYVKTTLSSENLSIKLVSGTSGFNQIDKRWIKKYVEMWGIPNDVTLLLKLFTGEISLKKKNLRNKKRMFFDEMNKKDQKKVLDFFSKNKSLVISDTLKGRGKYSTDWMLVVQKGGKTKKWVLKSINDVMNFFGEGEVKITPRGSLKIGQVTMQRKGGDGGKDTAQMLQFKINPVALIKMKH